ncbi:bacteriocin [Pedobacter endophyticus]|uniref:Bacteriocin n=1 Tax=Pedobacter endophyticus TaxID=2789740 RepID=A0A7U3Q446_9SPHI|nr:bacteriocin [Pedobacter endophyticus]QPH38202.1 bacteriocin [Pedobacter endophyticus]
MKNLELENFGVQELDAREMKTIDGGGWLRKLGWGYLATEVIDHWDEIKKGFSNGWNA